MHVGVDIGGTYARIATASPDGGDLRLYRDQTRLDADATPCTIAITGPDAVVGHAAGAGSLIDARVARRWRPRLGAPAPVYRDATGEPWRAEELHAVMIRKLRFDVEAAMTEPIDGVVIAVPGWFNPLQRSEALAAVEMAGLDAADVLDEPVAICIQHSVDTQRRADLYAVFDIGGSECASAIVSRSGGRLVTLRAERHADSAGGAVDDKLADLVRARYRHTAGREPLLNERREYELKAALAQAKIELLASGRGATRCVLDFGTDMREVQISRADLEVATAEIARRHCEMLWRTLAAANIDERTPFEVVLAGGCGHLSTTHDAIKSTLTHQQTISIARPSAVVAGTASWAASIRSNESDVYFREASLDTTSDALAFVTRSESGALATDVLFAANTPLPSGTASRSYFARSEGQQRMRFRLVRLGAASAEDSVIADLVRDIPEHAARPGEMTVTVRIDAAGRVYFSSTDGDTVAVGAIPVTRRETRKPTGRIARVRVNGL